MNGIVKNIAALSIRTTAQIPSLTKGQKALLSVIKDCINKKLPLTFQDVVIVYYNNVRKTFSAGHGWYYPENGGGGRYREFSKHDILDAFNNGKFQWRVKVPIRQWFVANIGILVIKNQLLIIPTIDLGEEEIKSEEI